MLLKYLHYKDFVDKPTNCANYGKTLEEMFVFHCCQIKEFLAGFNISLVCTDLFKKVCVRVCGADSLAMTIAISLPLVLSE